MTKTLDIKLARLHADSSCKDFILADAKDADMAYGMAAPGQSPEHVGSEARFRTLAQYRDLIRQNVQQGLIDIMLMSASTSDVLTIKERLFDHSSVTPACRANDTSDIWLAQGGLYPTQPSRPFRTATIDHMMCGQADCPPEARGRGVNLGLYSLTFNNDTQLDHDTLQAYADFRLEAEREGFRHFLEVFNPNACGSHCPPDVARYLNDQIARTLAGVAQSGRPIFLKIPYHGPAAMEQLVAYDSSMIVGVLGGPSGTTFDAFHQLWEARKYGARAALYSRMINNSEHQPTFIQHLRWLADGDMDDPAQAVRSYHGALQKLGIKPYRSLKNDLLRTDRALAYSALPPDAPPGGLPSGSGLSASANVSARMGGQIAPPAKAGSAGAPDFSTMTPAEKVAWNLARWDRILR